MFRVKGKASHLSGLKHAYKPQAIPKPSSVPFNVRRFASTNPPKKNNSGVKIAAGITLLCGGGLVGSAALYNYNVDFRNFVNSSLPIIETFNLALGPVTNNSYTNDDKVEEMSFMKPKDEALKPIIDVKKTDTSKSDSGQKVKESPKPSRDTASLSSVDQASISSVDLDIAKVVEEVEVKNKTVKAESPAPPTPPVKSTEQAAKKPTEKEPSAAVSVLDNVGVSSVDLDIVRKAKHIEAAKPLEFIEVTPIKESETPVPEPLRKEDVTLSKPIDTGLTSKEVDAMVDQTAMEVLIGEGLLTLKKCGQEAIAAQHTATEAVLFHADKLKHALEQEEAGSMRDLSKTVLSSQKVAEEAVEAAKTSQLKLNEEVEKFHILVKEAEAAGAKEASVKAAEEAARVSYGVLNATGELQKAKAEDLVLGEYQKFFDESKSVLKKELEEVMPGALKKTGKGQKGADKDATRTETVLLAYARKRLEHLKQELTQQRQEEQKRLEQILSVQREEDVKLTEMRLKQEREKLKADFDVAFKKRESEMSANYETDLRQQLRRQAAAYSDHLTEVLKVQASELQERHQADLEETLNKEKKAFGAKITSALSRLRGVESAVDKRAEIERVNKRSQELWIACQALNTAIDRGYEVRRPLQHEVTAVYEASSDDPVVSKVLESIPSEALERGVHSEENLASRFPKVRRQCRRVAMIGDEKAGPWSYVLSYLQSFFIFDGYDPAKEGGLVDIEAIDTFGLLARAQYYLQTGELELAARFLNQLEGEPRQLAYDWLREARVLLETRQAARFLASYAAAAGMGAAGV